MRSTTPQRNFSCATSAAWSSRWFRPPPRRESNAYGQEGARAFRRDEGHSVGRGKRDEAQSLVGWPDGRTDKLDGRYRARGRARDGAAGAGAGERQGRLRQGGEAAEPRPGQQGNPARLTPPA